MESLMVSDAEGETAFSHGQYPKYLTLAIIMGLVSHQKQPHGCDPLA